MNQVALFHDSIYDAISADIQAIGGIKKAAALLWPSNSDAAGRLRACLSVEHAQKLDPEELMTIVRLARAVGSTAVMNYLAQHLSFKVEWISLEDKKAELQRQFVESIARAERLAQQLKVLA